MSRWKQQDATVCIFGTVNCAFGENASDARRIVTEHNTDCDAYEEKIAELQRRLDAVVAEVYVALLDRCYCEEVDDEDFDEQEQCEYCLRIAKLRAIAEGREG